MFYYMYGRVEITWNKGESILKLRLKGHETCA